MSLDKFAELKRLHEEEIKQRKSQSMNEATPVTTPKDASPYDIDITSLSNLKKAYNTLKVGFNDELGGLIWNRQTIVSLLVGLLVAEKIKQTIPSTSKGLVLPLLKLLKSKYNISDEFVEKEISQKFQKLKAFNIITSNLDNVIKENTNEALSISQLNKLVDKVIAKNKVEPTSSETKVEPEAKTEDKPQDATKKFDYLAYVKKVWTILKPVSKITIANFEKLLTRIENMVVQFKQLKSKEGQDSNASRTNDKIQNLMFILFFISLKDMYNITVSDITSKVVTESKEPIVKNKEVLTESETEEMKFIKLTLRMLKSAGIKIELSPSNVMAEVKSDCKKENPTMNDISDWVSKKLKSKKSLTENASFLVNGAYQVQSVTEATMNHNGSTIDINSFEKIQPQYMQYLVKWQGQVLQDNFGKWKQFFEFSFKNSLNKVTEKDRMFVEIMKIVYDTLKNDNITPSSETPQL